MTSRHTVRMKRLAHLLISMVVLAFDSIGECARRAVTGERRATGVVLYYHQVRSAHRAAFARQMDILVRSAEPMRADRREPLNGAAHYAAVTFDDGYQNVVENAIPELVKRRIPATIFIITEALGQYPNWLTNPRDPAQHEKVMSHEQLLELPADLVTVGSHTMTHPALTTLSESDARRELSGSRAKLEAILNREIKLFSFPYGRMNPTLATWCRESGYERVFTISPTLAFRDRSERVTGRVSVEPTDWPLEFHLKLRGAYRWLPLAHSLKRQWLAPLRGGVVRHA